MSIRSTWAFYLTWTQRVSSLALALSSFATHQVLELQQGFCNTDLFNNYEQSQSEQIKHIMQLMLFGFNRILAV